MKVEIDLERLKDIKLTSDEYLYLFCIYYNINHYSFEVNLDNLESYLKEGVLTDAGKKLFEEETPESKFNELFYTYRYKTGPKGRVLRPANIDSKEGKTLGIKYKNRIKNEPGLHEKIMSALKKEIQQREDTGKMEFMPMMSTWMHQELWDRYMGDDDYDEPIERTTAI